MPITRGTGNLLTQDADALVNTVNTEGIMGKGIALQFKKAWPAMFKDYEAACKRGEVTLGRMHVWETGSLAGPRYIINFPTKRHWRSRSKLVDIETGLQDLTRVIGELGIVSIAIPPLGCGNGGLDWRDVEPRILRALEPLAGTVGVRIFAPKGAPSAAEQPSRERAPKMTPPRAALLALMREYERVTFEPPTLVEVQKLAYFLQTNGEALRLVFTEAVYGPYADDLRKSLRNMEGHFIIGFGDGSLPITKAEPIQVKPEIYEALDRYIASHPATAARIRSVLSEIEGFESTYGLELLATVHWVMTHDSTAMANSGVAHQEVRRWNQRKSSLFTQPHVESAWHVVHDRGLAATS
ncbi:MAG TPA: macro domain-containing protein [Streptosporangiaceae bacterium]|nr:macro domain-containing protein [Streptosporangiaceae bacterium]